MSGTAALIVAAGRGVRAGGGEIPKQYKEIGSVPILTFTLERFLSHPRDLRVLVVTGSGDEALYKAAAPRRHPRLLPPVAGGSDRQQSVRNGLAALAADPPERVLIHDAVRPFASSALIERVIAGLDEAEAVLPASPVAATLKRVEKGIVAGTVDREGLRTAETPQGFRFETIVKAHAAAAGAGLVFTDDAGVAEWAGIPVKVVAGEAGNIKLTTAEEIADADRRLAGERALALGDVRVGSGYDVHPFGPGDHVTLGGIVIPHERGVTAHSDGDVALHALTDAILGALAEGDIGDHFPPSDPQWKDAASERFLRFAAERVAVHGGIIANLDVTIVTEAPRVGRHRDAMRQRIAAVCGIGADRVAVKATTSERLGFIGRGEGLAASATATIRLPFGKTP